MADAVVEGEDDWEEGLCGVSVRLGTACLDTHHCRGTSALDVSHDAVEESNATAYCEQQQGEQRTHGFDTPALSAPNEARLGPVLLGMLSGLPVAERYRDISRGQLWLVRSAGPGFHCDNEQACEQQHDAGSVEGLVEGERMLDRRRSGQVAAC